LALDEEGGETHTWIPSAAYVHLQNDLQDKGKTPRERILKGGEEMGDLEENAATTAAAGGREGGRESKDKITSQRLSGIYTAVKRRPEVPVKRTGSSDAS